MSPCVYIDTLTGRFDAMPGARFHPAVVSNALRDCSRLADVPLTDKQPRLPVPERTKVVIIDAPVRQEDYERLAGVTPSATRKRQQM